MFSIRILHESENLCILPNASLLTVVTSDKPKKQDSQPEPVKLKALNQLAELEAEISKHTKAAVESYSKAILAIRGLKYDVMCTN